MAIDLVARHCSASRFRNNKAPKSEWHLPVPAWSRCRRSKRMPAPDEIRTGVPQPTDRHPCRHSEVDRINGNFVRKDTKLLECR